MQAQLEDYIGEAFVKCAHIILGSRIFQLEQDRPPVDRRSGRWFLLEIEELAGLTQHLEPWRRDVYAPLIIEVSIRPWDTSTVMPTDSSSPAGRAAGGISSAGPAGSSSMLLERWTLCFSPGVSSGSSNSRAGMDTTAAVYKRLILLIRSLYSYVRVLPAYRMYRACKRHGGELFNTSYGLSTTADPSILPLHQWASQQQQQQQQASSAAAGINSSNGGRMCQFGFTAVETPGGSFSIHVEYQPATTVHILEQTTIPVSMPRIISDYVDSPYARSAPNTAEHTSSRQGAGRTVSRLSGPDGPVALLRSSQLHHTPLVRHSWSSRDVSGPSVVQRGFTPTGPISSSYNQPQVLLHPRTSSQGSGSLASMMLSPAAGGQSPVFGATAGTSSSLGRPPLPHSASLHAAAAHGPAAQGVAAAGYSSSLPSAYGGLVSLPPASPGTPSTGGLRSPLFRSSSLSAAAAIGAGTTAAVASGPHHHHQQQQQQQSGGVGGSSSSRMGSSPTLVQQLRPHLHHARPPVQPLSPHTTQQGFHVKEMTAPHTAGTGSSSSAAGGGSGPAASEEAVAGDAADHGSSMCGTTANSQQQQQVVGVAPDVAFVGCTSGPYAAGQQHHAQVGPRGSDAAAAAGAVHGGVEAEGTEEGARADRTAAAAVGVAGRCSSSSPGSDGSVRAVSAPVMIPHKAKGVRARSVSDLAQLDAEAVVAAARHTSALAGQQQAEGLTDWQQQQQQQQQDGGSGAAGDHTAAGVRMVGRADASAATAAATARTVAGAAGGGFATSSSSGLLKVHHLQQQQQQQQHQQQQRQQSHLVQAPSSAPAAPRGMLGQLLSAGSGPTSPAFSPRGAGVHRGSSSRVVAAAMAAAAAATTSTREGGMAHHAANTFEDPEGADSDSSSGTSSAADGIISSTPTPRGAIIIRPNPLGHLQHVSGAAGAGAAAGGVGGGSVTAGGGVLGPMAASSLSPGGSSSCGSQPNSLGSRVLGRHAQRALAAQQGFTGPGSSSSGPYHLHHGVQPSTPTAAPHSYLGSSPQLPFAFTPSATSLGTSLMSLVDPQRQQLPPPPSGLSGNTINSSSGNSGPHKALPAPLSRPGITAVSAAAAAAAGSGGAAPLGSAAESSPSGGPTTAAAAGGAGGAAGGGGGDAGAGAAGAGGSSAVSGVTAGSAGSGAAGGAMLLAVGTPSPPLLYSTPPHHAGGQASGGQVSFIRDISGLATIRRPSWSSRSSSFDIAAAGSATLPHHLSMSPGMADLMDPTNLLMGYSSSHGSSAPGPHPLLRLTGAAGGGYNSSGSSSVAGMMGASSGAAAAPAAVYRWNLGPQQQQQQQAGAVGIQQQQQQSEQQLQQQHPGDMTPLSTADAAGAVAGDSANEVVGGDDTAAAAAAGSAGDNASRMAAAGGVAAAVGGVGGYDEALGGSAGHADSESDLLPFVLDAEPTAAAAAAGGHHQHHASGLQMASALGGGYYGGDGAGGGAVGRAGLVGAVGGGNGTAAAGGGGGGAQKDVAVGAFLRLVQEAAAAPVGRLDRRQALWHQQQQQQAAGLAPPQTAEGVAAAAGDGSAGLQQEYSAATATAAATAPVCVGHAVQQVQDLAAQLQQLLFPEQCA